MTKGSRLEDAEACCFTGHSPAKETFDLQVRLHSLEFHILAV